MSLNQFSKNSISPKASTIHLLSNRHLLKGWHILSTVALCLLSLLFMGTPVLATPQAEEGERIVTVGNEASKVVLIRIRALSFNQRMGDEASIHLLSLLYETLDQHHGARVILLFGSGEKMRKMYRRLGQAAEGLALSPDTLLNRLEFWVLPESEVRDVSILRWGQQVPGFSLGGELGSSEGELGRFSDSDIFARLRLQRSFNLGRAKMLVEILGREDEVKLVELNLEGARLSVLKSIETYVHASQLSLPVEIRLNLGQGLASSLFLGAYLNSPDQSRFYPLEISIRTPYEPEASSLPLRSLEEFLASENPQDKALREEALKVFSADYLSKVGQQMLDQLQSDLCRKALTSLKK